MKILVLNGSPKGMTSITMQYVHFMANRMPECAFEFESIAQRIRLYENQSPAFHALFKKIEAADLILWASPIYFGLLPAQMMRLFELIDADSPRMLLSTKRHLVLTSSVHFLDTLAQRYIHSVFDQLKFKIIWERHVDMHDMLDAGPRHAIERAITALREQLQSNAILPCPQKQFLILHDGSSIARSAHERIEETLHCSCRLIDIRHTRIISGCIGCIHCGRNNRCVLDERDDYMALVHEIQRADAVLIAPSLRFGMLSSPWKALIYRGYRWTHQPRWRNKLLAILLSEVPSPALHDTLRALAEFEQARLGGIVTSLESLALACGEWSRILRHDLDVTISFWSAGGNRILRDHCENSFPMSYSADRAYYHRHADVYFTPKRNKWRNRFLSLISWIPGFEKLFYRRVRDVMILPYQRYLHPRSNRRS